MVRLTEQEIAVLSGLLDDERRGAPGLHGFPGMRPVEDARPGLVTQRFLRYESTKGYITVADADTEIIEFSGMPDSIEIWVLTNNVLVTFVNVEGAANEPIQVNASNFYEPGIAYRRVIARNAVAGVVGTIQVVGKWVER